jgi:hypothetical protein
MQQQDRTDSWRRKVVALTRRFHQKAAMYQYYTAWFLETERGMQDRDMVTAL